MSTRNGGYAQTLSDAKSLNQLGLISNTAVERASQFSEYSEKSSKVFEVMSKINDTWGAGVGTYESVRSLEIKHDDNIQTIMRP